jgi:hypothetical protein
MLRTRRLAASQSSALSKWCSIYPSGM